MRVACNTFFLLITCVLGVYTSAQVKVIDNKGTFAYLDTSKWNLSGINIFNKNTGNVGIGTNTPATKFHTVGTVRLESLGINTSNTNLLTTDANGNVTTRTIGSLLGTATTNTLSLSTNTLTSTVNGISAASNAVSGVSNTSSANNLSTTVNGVAGSAVPIINTNTLGISGGVLTSTVNGIPGSVALPVADGSETKINAGTNIAVTGGGTIVNPYVITNTFTEVDGSTTNELNSSVSSSGNILTVTDPGGAKTAAIVNANSLASGSNSITSSVNGVPSTLTPAAGTIGSGKVLGFSNTGDLVIGSAPTTTTNTLSLSTNTLTSTVNGVSATSNAVSGVSNTSSANNLSTIVNGVTGANVPIINSNALAGTGNKITSTVNGIPANLTPSSGTIAASKVLGFSAAGDLVIGNDPTATTVSNTVTAPNSLTTTVNGVTGAVVSMVTGVSNTSAVNTISTTVNGVAGTGVNIINTNTLAGASNKITSTVNGVVADLTPVAGTIGTGKALGFDASGNLVAGAVPITASNGISLVGNDIQLGGTLSKKDTIVTSASNTLSITGLQSGSIADSIVVADATSGALKRITASRISSASGWALTGNAGTTAGTNFVGTTDQQDLVFKVGNATFGGPVIESGRLSVFNGKTAFGNSAVSTDSSVAIGAKANNTSIQSVAVGANTTSQFKSTSLGYNAGNSSSESVAVGQAALSGFQAVAIGSQATANNSSAIAIGRGSAAAFQGTVIGAGSSANGNNSTVIGVGVSTSQANAFILGNSSAQVGIGTTTPVASSVLDVTSTTKGVLVPRMTSAQRTAIASPSNGLLVYDITTNCFWVFKSSLWVQLVSGAPTLNPNNSGSPHTSTSYTLQASDNGSILEFNNAGLITVTVPTGLPVGFQVSISQLGNGQVRVVGSGVTINSPYGFTRTARQWSKIGVEITSTATSAILSGDGAP